MNILIGELIIVIILFIGYRICRKKYLINRSGYITRVDSYIQGNDKVLIEDIHFWRNKANNYRRMRVDRTNLVYSQVSLNKDTNLLMTCGYCAPILDILVADEVAVKRTLTLGGAGGAVPLYILKMFTKALVDIVEISPESIQMCEKYFLTDFAGPDSRLRQIEGDAKDVIKTLTGEYQFIFCDLYITGRFVEDVFSTDFVERLNNLAGERGILAINASGLSIAGIRMLTEQLLGHFAYSWVMMLPEGFACFASNHEYKKIEGLMASRRGVMQLYPSLFSGLKSAAANKHES